MNTEGVKNLRNLSFFLRNWRILRLRKSIKQPICFYKFNENDQVLMLTKFSLMNFDRFKPPPQNSLRNIRVNFYSLRKSQNSQFDFYLKSPTGNPYNVQRVAQRNVFVFSRVQRVYTKRAERPNIARERGRPGLRRRACPRRCIRGYNVCVRIPHPFSLKWHS